MLDDFVSSGFGDSVELPVISVDVGDSDESHIAQPVSEREDSSWLVEFARLDYAEEQEQEYEQEEAKPTNVEELNNDNCFLEPPGRVGPWLSDSCTVNLTILVTTQS